MQAHAHLARVAQEAADARASVAAWAAAALARPTVGEVRGPDTPSTSTSTPADADALRLQGNAAFRAKDWSKAADLYAASMAAHPAPEAATNRAAALLRLGNPAAALASADAALRLRPSSFKAHLRRSQALAALGAEEQAFLVLDEAMARWGEGGEDEDGWAQQRAAALATAAAARGWKLPQGEGARVEVPVVEVGKN